MTAKRIFVLASTLFLLGSWPIQAQATNWLGHNAGYDSTITFDQRSLTTGFHDAFHWTITENVDRTELSSTLYHDSSYEREVKIYDDYYGDTGWAGRWYCARYGSVHFEVCEVGIVQFNLSYSADYSTNSKRHLACHEVGHSLGLAHGSGSSCMVKGGYDYRYFTSHDIGHINYFYPYQVS